MDQETMDSIKVAKGQEASVPVQGRVNIVNLAELVLFWESQGYFIRTMSQLVGWSIELVANELKRCEMIPEEVDGVAEANNVLRQRNLYQNSLRKRSERKMSYALGFESLRRDGVDPKEYAPGYYKQYHNQKSVRPLPDDVRGSNLSQEQIQKFIESTPEWQQEKLKEQQRRHEEREGIKRQIAAMKESGVVAEEPPKVDLRQGASIQEINEDRIRKDAEVVERENDIEAQLEFLKGRVVKE